MNPFSAFLQPPTQRSPLEGAGEFVNQLSQLGLQRKQLAQNATAQADSSARDWKRIGLQEAVQNRNFSEADKKQVESLLAEYQDAEDQGDKVRLSRATQMLKRFGMDVTQQAPQGATEAPDLSQEDFEKKLIAESGQPPALPGMLPQIVGPGKPQDFTGAPPQTQAQFEADLIANPQSVPESPEGGADEGPDIAGHLKSVAKLRPLPGTMGPLEMTSGEGATVGTPKPTKGAPAEQATSAPQAVEPQPLPGQLPFTRISQGGKTLYESTGPSGRWAPMVQGVFQPFTSHENPEIASAAKRSQAIAGKLIEVDGMEPKDAIKIGMDYLNNEANRIIGLERTKLGSKPQGGGGGGATFTIKGRLPYSNLIHQTFTEFKNENVNSGIQGYDMGLSAINSSNPASQYDAINQLLAARSGKVVSDRERQIYDRLAGVWEEAKKKVNMAAGNPMPEGYRSQIRQLLSEAKQAVVEYREQRAKAAEAAHTAKLRGADEATVAADSKAVGDMVRLGSEGGGEGPTLDDF